MRVLRQRGSRERDWSRGRRDWVSHWRWQHPRRHPWQASAASALLRVTKGSAEAGAAIGGRTPRVCRTWEKRLSPTAASRTAITCAREVNTPTRPSELNRGESDSRLAEERAEEEEQLLKEMAQAKPSANARSARTQS